MAIRKLFPGAALAICTATLMIHAPLSAHQKVQGAERSASAIQIRDYNTNQAMLAALLARRADVARSAANAQSRHSALNFLDRQIATVRSRLAE